jgi:hypothetical protein
VLTVGARFSFSIMAVTFILLGVKVALQQVMRVLFSVCNTVKSTI